MTFHTMCVFVGTYMNQYMVIDLKRYQPRKHLEDNLLWVVEQIPGLVIAADQTAILRKGTSIILQNSL